MREGGERGGGRGHIVALNEYHTLRINDPLSSTNSLILFFFPSHSILGSVESFRSENGEALMAAHVRVAPDDSDL